MFVPEKKKKIKDISSLIIDEIETNGPFEKNNNGKKYNNNAEEILNENYSDEDDDV